MKLFLQKGTVAVTEAWGVLTFSTDQKDISVIFYVIAKSNFRYFLFYITFTYTYITYTYTFHGVRLRLHITVQ